MGWTPYHYVHQNPINLIDPTGMSADGWGKKGNTWEYKEEITADNYKDLKYDEYMESGTVFSQTNGVADGEYSYSLNSDGTVNNSYGRSMNESFTTARGTTINVNNDNNELGNLKTLERNLNILDFYSTYSETIGMDNSFIKNLGRLVSIGSPIVSYKTNSIEYDLGMIDKDRRNFRNMKATSSAIIGSVMGRYHPAIGYISGKTSDQIFDAVEFSADYLNNGFNQLKNQMIFNISNSYR